MRICHALFSNPWDVRSGGGQLVVHKLAETMTALGHEVHVIYSARDIPLAIAPAYHVHFTRQRSIGAINCDFVHHAMKLWQLSKSKRFDRVFVHGENGLLFPELCRMFGMELHGVLHASSVPGKRLARSSDWHEEANVRMLFRALRGCVRIYAFSRFTQRRARAAGLEATRETVLGISPEWLGCYAPNATRDRNGGLRAISWGRLEKGKGNHLLIDAFAKLAQSGVDCGLEIIGEGSLRPELSRYADQRLADRVTLSGRLRPDAIRQRLLAADIAVFASRMESFSMAVAEASASGIPTFSTDAGGTSTALSFGAGGTLIAERSADAIARAISDYMRDPAIYSRIARKGVSIARQRTWEKTVAALLHA